jgi:hypothetical protein
MQAEALFNFEARSLDQLTFAKGNILEISIHRPDGKWWFAKLGGKQGWIPHNYVKIINSEEEKAISALFSVVAISDYESDKADYLGFNSGEEMQVVDLNRDSKKWWRAVKHDGQEGWIPVQFVKKKDENSRKNGVDTQNSTEEEYDFQKEKNQEMPRQNARKTVGDSGRKMQNFASDSSYEEKRDSKIRSIPKKPPSNPPPIPHPSLARSPPKVPLSKPESVSRQNAAQQSYSNFQKSDEITANIQYDENDPNQLILTIQIPGGKKAKLKTDISATIRDIYTALIESRKIENSPDLIFMYRGMPIFREFWDVFEAVDLQAGISIKKRSYIIYPYQ